MIPKVFQLKEPRNSPLRLKLLLHLNLQLPYLIPRYGQVEFSLSYLCFLRLNLIQLDSIGRPDGVAATPKAYISPPVFVSNRRAHRCDAAGDNESMAKEARKY